VEDNVLEPPAPQYNPRLNLHITFNAFLKDLRDAATACPSEIIQTSSFGEITLGDLLWEEGEMVLRHPQVRYYNAALAPLSLAQVKTPGKNTIDPTKFYSVTWVNEGERAHAMTQGDMGSWFLTTATNFAWYDRPANVPYYLYLARAAFRPFAIRSNLGGVRNNKGRYKCYNNMYCYWFHSQSIESVSYPSTILNQHLHAVRDALVAHLTLAEWRDHGFESETGVVYPLPAPFKTDPFIDQLRELARGGLFQLAYARGSTVDEYEPPNLWDFRHPYVTPVGLPPCFGIRYAADYGYFFTGAKPTPETPNGPFAADASNTCHYHYHSLVLLGEILETIKTTPSLWNDSNFKNLYFKLLYGRKEGDKRTCQTTFPGSRDMIGVPLAEYYAAGKFPLPAFQDQCTGKYANDPEDFMNGSMAPFLDEAYTGCNFCDE
jgi:hypothetical protein